MSVYICFGSDEEGMQVASNRGWSDLGDWISTIPYSLELTHLFDHGWCQKLDELEEDLRTALHDHEPASKDTRSTLVGLLNAVRERPAMAVSCTITNGFSKPST